MKSNKAALKLMTVFWTNNHQEEIQTNSDDKSQTRIDLDASDRQFDSTSPKSVFSPHWGFRWGSPPLGG